MRNMPLKVGTLWAFTLTPETTISRFTGKLNLYIYTAGNFNHYVNWRAVPKITTGSTSQHGGRRATISYKIPDCLYAVPCVIGSL